MGRLRKKQLFSFRGDDASKRRAVPGVCRAVPGVCRASRPPVTRDRRAPQRAAMDAAAIARRQHDIEESMNALAYYKSQNEDALRRALAKDKAVRQQTQFTSKEAVKRERIEWLQRIVDEESTKPLQVPNTYVQGYTAQATDYSRKVANTNARRVQALRKVQGTLEAKEARKAREAGYRRRKGAGANSSLDSSVDSMPSIEDTGMPGLDEVMQLEGQLRAQAERHAVDGSLPLDAGPNMLSILSDHDTSRPQQTVFRKKRNDSTLTAPAMTYYTIKQASSEGDLSVGGSELGSSYGGGSSAMSMNGGTRRVSNGRRAQRVNASQSAGGIGGMSGMNSSMNGSGASPEHIEKLEAQRAAIAEQRERSRRLFEEKRKELAARERKADTVIRDWLKKQKNVDKVRCARDWGCAAVLRCCGDFRA